MRAEVAALWHVIEHVPEPVELAAELRSVVFPDGLLVLEVPNLSSTDAVHLGASWDGAQPSDHYHHYRPAGMVKLLESAGWTDVDVLETTTRLYEPLDSWRSKKNRALADCRPWPPLDLLRVAARNPG